MKHTGTTLPSGSKITQVKFKNDRDLTGPVGRYIDFNGWNSQRPDTARGRSMDFTSEGRNIEELFQKTSHLRTTPVCGQKIQQEQPFYQTLSNPSYELRFQSTQQKGSPTKHILDFNLLSDKKANHYFDSY